MAKAGADAGIQPGRADPGAAERDDNVLFQLRNRSMLTMLALLQQAAPLSDTAAKNIGLLGPGIGFGLAILGLGIGMGRIGGAIADGIARQPEAAKEIANGPFIIAILLEGATIIALVFALLFKLL